MRGLCTLLLCATAGCTFTTDFDREYAGDAELPDAAPMVKDAAPPAKDTELCGAYCRSVARCLSDPGLCHAFAVSSEQDRQDFIDLCNGWCFDTAQGVTQEEMLYAEDPRNCPEVVRAVRESSPELDSGCEAVVEQCMRACDGNGGRFFEECTDDHRPCLDVCLSLPIEYWTCVADKTCGTVCGSHGREIEDCLGPRKDCMESCANDDPRWPICLHRVVSTNLWAQIVCQVAGECAR